MNEPALTQLDTASQDSDDAFMASLTPKQIVEELDKFIVGQIKAKRAVGIALRNRWRRQQLPDSLRDEVGPKNILMIGPTGVGKTEIARRLAKLSKSPFIKVEASKYTEVGYVGRDVESMIRDLVELSKNMVKEEWRPAFACKPVNRPSKNFWIYFFLPHQVCSPTLTWIQTVNCITSRHAKSLSGC